MEPRAQNQSCRCIKAEGSPSSSEAPEDGHGIRQSRWAKGGFNVWFRCAHIRFRNMSSSSDYFIVHFNVCHLMQ